MASTYKRRYGLDWPVEMHDTLIDMRCWKHWRDPRYAAGKIEAPWECFFKATRVLFPAESFSVSRWTEEHVYDWTTEKFIITWGAAASSKSNDYGLLALLDWVTDPTKTYTVMASTTKEALKIRCFESVLRYFKLLKHGSPFLIPGKVSKTMTAIVNDDEADIFSTDKAGIRGVAVDEGTESEAIGKLRGGHADFVRLILDELSQMRSAAMKVRTNMQIGAKDFKVAGLTNIDSFYDLAGQYSTPIGGWSEVNPSVEHWRTQWGVVRRHDGLRSPAIMEPGGAEKYPHILNQKTLDDIIAQEGGNDDAPQIWIMVRAWPPQEGKSLTVMTEAEVAQWKMQDDVEWSGLVTNVAGLDPAFVSGGNGCIFQPAKVGYDVNGKLIIAFGPTERLSILASSDTPALFQVTEQAAKLCEKYEIVPNYLGIDDSATQSVADVMDRNWQPGCLRVEFGAKPKEIPVSEVNPQLETKRYKDQVTALWYAIREFGNQEQIRKLPQEAAKQLTKRRIKKAALPLQLISKQEFEKDIHKSPDEADACALVMAVVKQRMGIYPGATVKVPKGFIGRGFDKNAARKYDMDSRPTYATEY